MLHAGGQAFWCSSTMSIGSSRAPHRPTWQPYDASRCLSRDPMASAPLKLMQCTPVLQDTTALAMRRGKLDSELEEGDTAVFISTLHGG